MEHESVGPIKVDVFELTTAYVHGGSNSYPIPRYSALAPPWEAHSINIFDSTPCCPSFETYAPPSRLTLWINPQSKCSTLPHNREGRLLDFLILPHNSQPLSISSQAPPSFGDKKRKVHWTISISQCERYSQKCRTNSLGMLLSSKYAPRLCHTCISILPIR
jgi:hypothetical protein